MCIWYAHGGDNMVLARMELNSYTNKVLNVVKAKYELKSKSEALNKFAEMYGDEVVEPEVKEEFVKKILKIHEEHMKQPRKPMTLEELDELCGVE